MLLEAELRMLVEVVPDPAQLGEHRRHPIL
jgi:hypothetical protein